MSDVDRLTVVVAVGFMLLVARLPEQDASSWGFARLTVSLATSGFLGVLLFAQMFGALGWFQ